MNITGQSVEMIQKHSWSNSMIGRLANKTAGQNTLLIELQKGHLKIWSNDSQIT
jgi:hypothetical protein